MHRAAGRQLHDERRSRRAGRRPSPSAGRRRASAGARRRGCARGSSPRPRPRTAAAVSTSSSSVVGSCGTSALEVSAPVGATVISSLSASAVGTAVTAVIVSDCARPVDSRDRKKSRMRAVVQRVLEASVVVDGKIVGRLDRPGLLVLLGVTHEDGPGRSLAGPQGLGRAHPARGEVRLGRGRSGAGGQPVHPVRRRAQGTTTHLGRSSPGRGVRADLRGVLRRARRGSARRSRAACSEPTCRCTRSTTDR